MTTPENEAVFSPAKTKVLVVGAGGIGCELLKNLVLSGYLDIEVVDLDTIELSNLNRQFLFRRRHISQYKAQVAAEAVCAMNPAAKVVPQVGNIMDVARFPLAFFQKFNIVLNALDNINARRYVNNMCQAVGLPLVESGTAGYLGQCTVHIPRKTECYECTAKQAPKTFPVCTIRSTPSAPIHCVVWAKDYLLSNIFGAATEDEIPADIEDSEHIASLKKETEAFRHLRDLAAQRSEKLGRELFDKVFHDDIETIRSISSLWESCPAPISLSLGSLEIPPGDSLSELDDQKVWSVEQWISLLFDSLNRLAKRLPEVISFDKDDQDTLDFVTAIANLRAIVYGIPMTSRFALKALAGNIIPAIATTNAIAAGMIVIQAENILSGHEENLADVFITFDASRPNFFLRSKPVAPNPACSICFVHRAILQCNTGHFKLGQVIDEAVPMFLARLGAPEVTTEFLSILEGSRMIYDEEDMPLMREKTLADLGATDTKFLRFQFFEGLPLVLAVQHDDSYGAAEFGCTFDLLTTEQVKLGSKRSLPDDDSGSDLEAVGEAEEDSDLEIIESPTARIKLSND